MPQFPQTPEELRQRRKDLNLDATEGALFICDDADQHRNPTYRRLRDIWQKENNAIILGSVKGDKNLPDVPGRGVKKFFLTSKDVDLNLFNHVYIKVYIRTYVHT